MISPDQTCCDDEIVRTGGNTSLPEQHFFINSYERKTLVCRPRCVVVLNTETNTRLKDQQLLERFV
jgi:hypothetical protein